MKKSLRKSAKQLRRFLDGKALRSALAASERKLKKLTAQHEKLRTRFAAHESPEKLSYQALLKRVQALVSKYVPRKSAALIVTKGDPALLEQRCKTVWHFPR